jgi:hypothetical protein
MIDCGTTEPGRFIVGLFGVKALWRLASARGFCGAQPSALTTTSPRATFPRCPKR